MKIRTIDALASRLDEESLWRKVELSKLVQLGGSGSDKTKADALSRAIVAMSYAHFEGFTKNSFELLATYVGGLKIYGKDLSSGMIGLRHRAAFLSAADAIRGGAFATLAERLRKSEEERFSAVGVRIETGSNLGSSVFKDVLACFGTSPDELIAGLNLAVVLDIDSDLVNTRNQIAHGRYAVVDFERAVETRDFVVALIDGISNFILNYTLNESYLR